MPRIRFILNYIWHWLSANSRHGVHSPFVYRLVDEVIYNYRAQTKHQLVLYRNKKHNELVNRLLDHFEPRQVLEINSLEAHTNSIHLEAAVLNPAKGEMRSLFEACLPKADAKTLLIVKDLYSDAERVTAWKTIKNDPKVTITIDLFWMGLVFFRQEQSKENFKIRF